MIFVHFDRIAYGDLHMSSVSYYDVAKSFSGKDRGKQVLNQVLCVLRFLHLAVSSQCRLAD